MLRREEFSEDLNNVLSYMEDFLVQEYPTVTLDLYYFILAVTTIDCQVNHFFENNISSNSLTSIQTTFAKEVSNRALGIVKPGREVKLSEKFNQTISNAFTEMSSVGAKDLTTMHVLLAILHDESEDNKIRTFLNRVGISYGLVLSKINNTDENPKIESDDINTINNAIEKAVEFFTMNTPNNGMIIDFNSIAGMQQPNKKKGSIISQYCTNLNDLAINKKIDKLVGRERETEEIIRVLGRRKKNNAILVGSEGVGKTAIAENIAYKIVNEDVPDFLIGKQVVSLDMTALMAGTTLRGMFEERVQGILNEIKAKKKYILMIDNIGAVLADKGKGDYDISAMLSTSLENGDIQVIGTSDFKSFRSTFDKDPSLSRKFQKIIVEPSSKKEAMEIINGVKPYYEDFHSVTYTPDAIRSCVELASRYIVERNLPDSAIDILDEAGSLVGKSTFSDEKVRELRHTVEEFSRQIDSKSGKNRADKIDIINQLNSATAELDDYIKKLHKQRKANPPVVEESTILEIVSKKTGIPISKLSTSDKKRLATIDERLKEEVVGQDEAIETICKSLKRNRIGLHGRGCMYSAMMLGRTGTGKTLIAKKLAKEMFGDEKALIRFDMSEYPDKTAVNKLIGSNPGYVGYEEGGQLTESVKNRKHCVLLLDEIEKADPEVYNIFLQVLDEGFLTDNSGMKVDFKNVIVLFTSNVGAKAASDFGKGIGFNEDEGENSKRIIMKQLKGRFPPEFLNRLDNVICFNSLTDDNLRDIIHLEIKKMINNLNEIGHTANYGDDVVEHILEIVSKEKEFGARPIMRAIRTEIEDKITDFLLLQDEDKEINFRIKVEDGEIKIEEIA